MLFISFKKIVLKNVTNALFLHVCILLLYITTGANCVKNMCIMVHLCVSEYVLFVVCGV